MTSIRLQRIMHACFLLCLFLLCSCGHSATPPASQPEPAQPTPISDKPPIDPTSGWTEEVRKAWSLFIQNGRYRMAQPEDFKFPKSTDEKYAKLPWIAWWGAFAVIVVDTTHTDQNRFGLILFVEPKDNWKRSKNDKMPWKPVWLYRNRDLSRTGLEQASGYWFVIEYSEDGIRKVCEVDWSERQQRYVCH